MPPSYPSNLLSQPSVSLASLRRRVSSVHEREPRKEPVVCSDDKPATKSVIASVSSSQTIDLDRPLPPLPLTPVHSHSPLRKGNDELNNQAFETIDLNEEESSARHGRSTPSLLSVSIPGFSIHSVVSRFWRPYAPSIDLGQSSRLESGHIDHDPTSSRYYPSSTAAQKSLPDLALEGSSRLLKPRSWLTRTVPLSLTPGIAHNGDGFSKSLDRSSSKRSSTTISNTGSESTFSVSSIGPTDKFTSKWPELRRLSTRNSMGRRQHLRRQEGMGKIAAALEDGTGLGMDGIGRWTIHKWFLILSICALFSYGVVGIVIVIKTWFHAYDGAAVMYVANNDILVLLTLASVVILLCSLVGITGTILNSRPILAIYALLLWPALVSMLSIGYTTYKRYAFSPSAKIDDAWSEYYTPSGRLIVQNALGCCGYTSPAHEAVLSAQCYYRTQLSGCKGVLFRAQREVLRWVWTSIFSLVPLHLLVLAIALLCANHVTKRFGKGITPPRYRLNGTDVRESAQRIMEGVESRGRVERPRASIVNESNRGGFSVGRSDSTGRDLGCDLQTFL